MPTSGQRRSWPEKPTPRWTTLPAPPPNEKSHHPGSRERTVRVGIRGHAGPEKPDAPRRVHLRAGDPRGEILFGHQQGGSRRSWRPVDGGVSARRVIPFAPQTSRVKRNASKYGWQPDFGNLLASLLFTPILLAFSCQRSSVVE